jgi:matrixin/Big-like domain-containing protein
MKPVRAIAILATLVALVAAATSATRAYSTYSQWGTLYVPFYVNPANADVSQNAAISALQTGMNVWNTQSGTAFRFGYAGQVGITTTGYDNKNVVLFRNVDNGSTIATTYVWSANGLLADSDIVFWDGGWAFFTGSAGCSSGAYIEDIAAHEFGHALGLLHSTYTDATMYPTYSRCSQSFRTLSSDDIAGAKDLYADGAGTIDTPPDVKILSPANGANVKEGVAVAFSGSAIDVPDGDISNKLVWKSSIEGQIGTGASFSRALKAGTHTITATATDSIGYIMSPGIVVYVTTGTTNTAPAVTISSPANGATVPAGTSVTFSGSASDTQDGSLTGSLVWKSSIEGQIGTGGSFSRAMKAGTHTISATVTDKGGLTTQKNITLNVGSEPSPSSGPTLTARGYKEKGLQKANLSWTGLTATTVDVYRSNTKISTTANDGSMTDAIDNRGGGSYTYKVCAAGTSTCTNQATVTF